MKKLFKVAAVAVLSLGFGVAAQAQSSNFNIAANASVVDQIEVARVADLSFGMVMQGLDKYVTYAGGVTGGGAANGPTPTAGVFNLFAGVGTNVTLAFTTPTNLTGPEGASMAIDFDKNLAGETGVSNAAVGAASDTATPFKVATGITLDDFDTNDIDGRNGLKVFIGGVVRPASNQASGNYTGVITLTATYN